MISNTWVHGNPVLRLTRTTALLAAIIASQQPVWAQTLEQPSSGLETIIVTATKREESLQQVPVAVSALSGDDIASTHVQGFADLAALVPGPTFVAVSGTSGSQLQMRGQYASDDSPGFDTPVGVFIDDIYYGSVASFNPDFYDLEQIAILRGPQGTTFGRNTVGGALQVISARPSFEGTSGAVSVTVRDPDGYESEGHINSAFSESVAARLAYSVRDYDGYRRNVTNGSDLNDKDVVSVRGSLRFQPAEELDILTSFAYTKDESLGDGPLLIGQGALIASLDAQRADQNQTFVDDDGRTDRDIKNGLVRVDWTLPIGTLTSITGYRSLQASYLEDIDGSPEPIAPAKLDVNDEEQYSQELRLTSPSGQTIEWIAGLYYLHQDTYRAETYTFGGLPPWRINTIAGGVANRVMISGDLTTKSYAPFGEVTWNIDDAWSLAAGVRYTHDEKQNLTVQQNLSSPGGSTIFFGAPKSVAAEDSWDAWTPRVVVEFKPTDDLFMYANVSRGYKSGGYNYAAATVAQAQTPILPEQTWSYEVGAKTDWLANRLRANLALYQTTTEDLQVRSLVGTTLQVNNAGEGETRGAELELTAQPIDALTMGLSYAYTDAEFKSYRGCAGTAAAPIDCTGNPIPFVPENSYSVLAQYAWTLPGDSTVTLRAEGSWADAYEVHIGAGTVNPATGIPIGPQFPRSMTKKSDIVNAFLTYEAPQGRWSVQAWARNLLDKQYVVFATNYFFYLLTNTEATTGGLFEADRATVNQARSYGLTFNYRFD